MAETTPVVGQQARLLDRIGKNLADLTRAGEAPNQQEAQALPPEFISTPSGTTRKNGDPGMEFGNRLMGANSIALRIDAASRGSAGEDPRYASPDRVEWVNREWKQTQDPVRVVNSQTQQAPEPVELCSHTATPVKTVHEKAGQAFGSGGEKGGLVDVAVGDAVYDAKGEPQVATQEMRKTYNVYHVSDLNVAGITPRTPPNASGRQLKVQDAAFAAGCEARGEPVRQPDKDERAAMVISDQLAKLLDDQRKVKSVRVVENVARISEARFGIQDGVPTIAVPRPEKFANADHQASSVVHACSHSNLHAAAA